jgi:hypothetical protein
LLFDSSQKTNKPHAHVFTSHMLVSRLEFENIILLPSPRASLKGPATNSKQEIYICSSRLGLINIR